MTPACHGGGSGGSYGLPRRCPAENCPHEYGCDNQAGQRKYAECSSRSACGGPLRRGRVAAHYRLSAPIRRSSPHEAGGGTIEQAVNKSRHQGRTDHLSRSRWRRGLVRSAMLKQARGKPDQTRSIPRKGYLCPQKAHELERAKKPPQEGRQD